MVIAQRALTFYSVLFLGMAAIQCKSPTGNDKPSPAKDAGEKSDPLLDDSGLAGDDSGPPESILQRHEAPKREDGSGQVVLTGYSREEAAALGRAIQLPWRLDEPIEAELKAYAYRMNSRVYQTATADAHTVGVFRRGTWLPVVGDVTGSGCPGGRWYRLASQGFVCTSDGVKVFDSVPDDAISSKQPDITRAMPHRYAVVKTDRAPLLERLPTDREHSLLESARRGENPWPAVLYKRMIGDYLMAMAGEYTAVGNAFWRNVRGQYVYKKDLKEFEIPPMVGEPLTGKSDFPLAFTFEDDTPVFKKVSGELVRVGMAERHARFKVSAMFEHGDSSYVMFDSDFVVVRDKVRLIETLPHPERVPAGVKWIHVNLTEQTLVAYDSHDSPVYATVISSGKSGFDTPRGTFQIRKKLLTATMSGPSPAPGESAYDVGEVPWVMYYFKNYALHGAYWHNTFGNTRSHGCTNISPVDAKWLFYWVEPSLPTHWHGIYRQKGTYVHFTR